MASTNDVINSLAGKTRTLDWDAVVAYDRESINRLLQQQYVHKLASGINFTPINWRNESDTIRFENLTLGAPLISFQNSSILDSRATATLDFIDGNIAELTSNGQVTRYTRVRPGMGYSLELDINLIHGKGTVDQEGKVLIDFSQASITVINGLEGLLAEVYQYFVSWLATNPVTYELGQLAMEYLGSSLTPDNFIIRTQPAPGAKHRDSRNYGDGAVLLFVATENNPDGGTLPTDTYPWLMPDEYSSTILVSNRLVLEKHIKPTMDKILDKGSWELVRGAGINDAWSLKASDDATINSGYIRVVNGYDAAAAWSGDYVFSWPSTYTEIHEDLVFSLKNAMLSSKSDVIELKYDDQTSNVQNFGAFFKKVVGTDWRSRKVRTSISGSASYGLTINPSTETIGFSLYENNSIVYPDFSEWEEWQHDNIFDSLKKAITERVEISNNILTAVPFEDINVFAVNHLLFPEHNINQLESAYLPGDVIIFGNIVPALTSLIVEPLTTTLPAGGSVQFTANASSVSWAITPADAGTISTSGLYRAPDTLDSSVLHVTVTATGASGGVASSLITVVPTSVLVSPAFVALNEDKLNNIHFATTLLGGNTLAEWQLTSSVPGLTGSITADGLYTPPDIYPDSYPYGYTYVTATAVASDGGTASAYILLINKDTSAEFSITPTLTSNMPLDSTLALSARATLDFDPNSWGHFPPLGELSTPVEDNGTYTVTYASPASQAGEELVIISTMHQGKAHRAGYALVDLTNSEPEAWSLIDGVNTLRVMNEAGGGGAQLYKNNVHQAALVVQFEGYQLINGIPREIAVTQDDLLPHIQIVDYVTGEPLPVDGGDKWFYSVQPNEFERLPTGLREAADGNDVRAVSNFTFYISCNSSAPSSSKRIAVSVTLASGETITTAANGTSGFNSAVTFEALPAIDYSLPGNIRISQSSLTTLVDNLSWGEHRVNTTTFSSREDCCELQVNRFFIQPAHEGISRFHAFRYVAPLLHNYDVSTRFFSWDDNPEERTFYCLNSTAGQQRSVLTRKGGTANIWFTGEQAELTSGQIYFSSTDNQTLFRVEIPEFSDQGTSDALPQVTLLKLATPLDDIQAYSWHSVNNPVVLALTDIYGNAGQLKLRWDEGDNYDQPTVT